MSNAAFPFGTSREIEIGYARVRASRITYVGELGWGALHPHRIHGPCVRNVDGGGQGIRPHPRRHAHHEQLPLREGLPPQGHDIADEDTPLEAGLGFTIAWDKPGGFIGREALLKQKAQPVQPKRFVCLALEDSSEKAPMIYHEEPIYRNGVIVGSTTSGAWGHRVNLSLG